jgi:hypothetical protein
MDASPDPTSLSHFLKQKESLAKLVQETSSLILQESQHPEHRHEWADCSKVRQEFLFGKYRHQQLEVKGNGAAVRSSIHGNKCFALGWPNLNLEPLAVREFSVKVRKCRDSASDNTVAVGISKLADMELAHFQGSPTNSLLVSSRGHVTLNGKTTQTSFTFREGDTLHFTYDPRYGTLDIEK